MIKFSSKLIKLEGNVWDIAIVIPTEIAEKFLHINDKRVICLINNEVEIQTALMPKGKNVWFINTNASIRKKLKIKEGDTVNVSIKTDPSEYGMPFPEEFEIALEQVENAKHFFLQQTKGNRRNLIRLINNVKSIDKRIEKSLIIAQYLVDVQGKIEYKSLNQALKNNN